MLFGIKQKLFRGKTQQNGGKMLPELGFRDLSTGIACHRSDGKLTILGQFFSTEVTI